MAQTHLPGFVADAERLKSKGVQEVACVSVNDVFVMAAWGKEHGADGKVRCTDQVPMPMSFELKSKFTTRGKSSSSIQVL